MQLSWAPEHSDALRELFARGMSYSEIAEAINARFQTDYSRNAALGRAKRMGLGDPGPPAELLKPPPKAMPWLSKPHERRTPELRRPMPEFERTETAKIRCVEIEPRRLSLMELERDDCRYPYGGDEEGEAITFCGHPKRAGSSYCTAHFHLTRGPGTASERAAGTFLLRLVQVA